MNDQESRPDRTGPTNPEVGRQIGLSYSAVSRIRSGDRLPSIAVMRKISRAYDWPLADQLAIIPEEGPRTLAYSQEFERRITSHNTNH